MNTSLVGMCKSVRQCTVYSTGWLTRPADDPSTYDVCQVLSVNSQLDATCVHPPGTVVTKVQD